MNVVFVLFFCPSQDYFNRTLMLSLPLKNFKFRLMVSARFHGTGEISFGGHFGGPVIFKQVAEHLTVELSLTVKRHSSVTFESLHALNM